MSRIFALTLLLSSVVIATYSVSVSAPSLNQLGGTGQVNVPKINVRVLRVQVPPSTITTVTVIIALNSGSGSFQVQAFLTVGACSASGSTTATLSTTPTTLTIPVSPSCPFNSQANVRIRVTQP